MPCSEKYRGDRGNALISDLTKPDRIQQSIVITMPTDDLIARCAERFGADAYSAAAIVSAWCNAVHKSPQGCLHTTDGQICFIHNRLRESGAFTVGCVMDDRRLSCYLHFFSDNEWSAKDAREFSAMFVRDDGLASTKTESIQDATPVNEVTRRAHKFPAKS